MSDRPPIRPPLALPELFAQALELDPLTRESFLDQARAVDPQVAREVEALLDASDEPSPVDQPLVISEAGLAAPSFSMPSLEGAEIAGMRVVRPLGAGSMGTVYEAQQRQPPRRVALKVLRPDAADLASRLLLEAEALSRLNHSSIAKVFGAGTEQVEERALVWMAFEFVPDARTLTEYAESLALSAKQRAHLVVEVCRAIEHAHGKGVLHRDLKPANLLVAGDGEGTVKVIDFGLARLTDPLDRPAQEKTRHGELLGTLLYMSPEQCSGEPASVDVRTDVYSLGIVLFELLTGSLPYDTQEPSILKLLDTIRAGKMRRLRQLRPDLDEDLESIVSQACALTPEGRYPSASALADDLEKWIAGEPVSARKAGLLHRARLFARRRRAYFVASALAAVAALVALTVIVSLAFDNAAKLREIERRDKAVAAARGELGSVTELLEGITGRDPGARSTQASLEAQRVETPEEKRAVVERAVADLERLKEQLQDDPKSLIQLARAFEQVGELHGTAWNAGALDAEGRHQANLRALELWRRVVGTGRFMDWKRAALFQTLIRLANSSRSQGDFEYGKGVADEAVGMARQERSRDVESKDALFDLIDALVARVDLCILDESPRQGLADAQECAELLNGYVARTPADALRKLDYESWSALRLGRWLKRAGEATAGLAAVRRARELRLEAVFATAASAATLDPSVLPSRQVRLAWLVFGRLEVMGYQDLGDEAGLTACLTDLAEAATRLKDLPLELYSDTLPEVAGFVALLADRESTPRGQAALEKAKALWLDLPRSERIRLVSELPSVAEDLAKLDVHLGAQARRYLTEVKAALNNSGE